MYLDLFIEKIIANFPPNECAVLNDELTKFWDDHPMPFQFIQTSPTSWKVPVNVDGHLQDNLLKFIEASALKERLLEVFEEDLHHCIQ